MDNSSSAPGFEEFAKGCGSKLLHTTWLPTGAAHLAEDLRQTAGPGWSSPPTPSFV
ncbi:hypothetical protein [Streptomyces sp. CB02400]|uniref:hypothetical protein n=1 Tax=unclassified Streptomyces TaxID=2593676 RepID=UPI001301169C|nr:hypothetical protein [Streptomyces sp. CB02400]